MSNGAAYGPGVYFSDTLSVSSEYCKRFISNQILTTNIKTNTKIERGWQHSQTINLSDNCIAICEIINRYEYFILILLIFLFFHFFLSFYFFTFFTFLDQQILARMGVYMLLRMRNL